MDKTIDTSRTIVVKGSTLGARWKLVWYSAGLLLWSGLIVLLILLLWGAGGWSDPVPYYVLIGLSCLLFPFFVLLVMLCLSGIMESRSFLKISDNVLTIAPNGIRDRRLTEEFVPWRAVKSVRTVPREPEHRVVPGYNTTAHAVPELPSPFRLLLMDVVLEIDPALTSQTFKEYARAYGILRAVGARPPLEDTRPWMKLTIDLWRLKNTDATALYDLCEAYARAAQAKHAA